MKRFDRKSYMLTYQREWARKRRAQYLKGKRCEGCRTKKGIMICGAPKRGVHQQFVTQSEKYQKSVEHLIRILCRKCKFASTEEDRRKRHAAHNEEIKQKAIEIITREGYPLPLPI